MTTPTNRYDHLKDTGPVDGANVPAVSSMTESVKAVIEFMTHFTFFSADEPNKESSLVISNPAGQSLLNLFEKYLKAL